MERQASRVNIFQNPEAHPWEHFTLPQKYFALLKHLFEQFCGAESE